SAACALVAARPSSMRMANDKRDNVGIFYIPGLPAETSPSPAGAPVKESFLASKHSSRAQALLCGTSV
ncbi:MAG: hypothetical protein E6662_18215, partial [Pantoea sp.]|nr:hypothetical protein [Pantoea sp.]